MSEDGSGWACIECERVAASGDDCEGWLSVQVSDAGSGFVEATFCSQQHAAEWMQRPLPGWEQREPEPATIGDRLFDLGCSVMFFVLVAFTVIGMFATVGFLVP